ncbi:hypothetical protein T265_06984 [Opisthorchis viverrini]|uniref:Uncharacterized protein n=1 Tax=Opisthorchis viverrini TaxID=6198 RepID=A0A074ZE83_OPIVI|nr:hypothetical protein T265_06984 [Opisthorchis viverrini]KER25581.1 hypothetical protein T265_06984 [Opisthorchis viverrini]
MKLLTRLLKTLRQFTTDFALLGSHQVAHSTWLIHEIKGNDCIKVSVGQRVRELHTTMGKRRRKINRKSRNADDYRAALKNSALKEHTLNTEHKIDLENIDARTMVHNGGHRTGKRVENCFDPVELTRYQELSSAEFRLTSSTFPPPTSPPPNEIYRWHPRKLVRSDGSEVNSELTDRKVHGSNPTTASRPLWSRLGQPGMMVTIALGTATVEEYMVIVAALFVKNLSSRLYCSTREIMNHIKRFGRVSTQYEGILYSKDIAPENVEVLRWSTSWRVIAEAAEIAKHPSVNRIEGVELASVWRSVLVKLSQNSRGHEDQRKSTSGTLKWKIKQQKAIRTNLRLEKYTLVFKSIWFSQETQLNLSFMMFYN